jgi:hypothetical protein
VQQRVTQLQTEYEGQPIFKFAKLYQKLNEERDAQRGQAEIVRTGHTVNTILLWEELPEHVVALVLDYFE